eukprot:7221765-Prymnesium_polylepis.1
MSEWQARRVSQARSSLRYGPSALLRPGRSNGGTAQLSRQYTMHPHTTRLLSRDCHRLVVWWAAATVRPDEHVRLCGAPGMPFALPIV